MWQWSDELKLGKSSVFVKRDLRALPLTDAEFEADFFLDPVYSTKRQEQWMGMVIEREFGGVLALRDVRLPPPTVNSLATLLFEAMRRPLDYQEPQRPCRIHLRDRPQWQELLPHLRQLQIEVVLGADLPRFDEAVIEWMQHEKAKKRYTADEMTAILRKPFPARKRSWFTDAMDLMEWSDMMYKGAYPTRQVAIPDYDPTTVVPIPLTAEELELILTQTTVAKTKKLRPRLEAMAAEGTSITLDIHDWSTVLSALCGVRAETMPGREDSLKIARRITNLLAEALGIDAPVERK